MSLNLSLIIFIILQIIIIIISKYITNKIVTPVKEAFEKQKQFITDASHELKTPLSVIIASTDAEEENNTITNNDKTGSFLRIQKDSWGNEGQNGGDVTLTLKNQKATGNIVVDSISTLNMKIKNGSYYEGTINKDKTAKNIKLTLDKTSKIKLAGDSYVTSLTDEDESYSNIDFNGYKLYVNGKAIN